MKTNFIYIFSLVSLVISAVELPIPERLELGENWKSGTYTAANGDEFELSFTLSGIGKLHGHLECNSNNSKDWPIFSAQSGENKFKLCLPDKGHPITYAKLHLAPEPDTKLICEKLRLSTETKIRRGDFSETKPVLPTYPGWATDKTQVFKVENGQANATLSGEQFAYIKQWVYLDPNKIYTVSVDLSAKDFSGLAGLSLSCRGGGKGIDKTLEFMPVASDTNGIKRLTYSFKTPAKINYCALRLAARGAHGKLTFDNVLLTEGAHELKIPGSDDFSGKLLLDGFFKVNSKSGWLREFAPALTSIELSTNNQKLRIRGVCREDQVEKIKAGVYPRDDSKIYFDDNVELFIDAQGIGRSYYQVIINPKGCIMDFYGKDSTWDGAEGTANITSDGWEFMVQIPYEKMGYGNMEASLPNKGIAMAFFRNRRTTDEA